jgi:D-sedoheptulose 7-phosphate isomerase
MLKSFYTQDYLEGAQGVLKKISPEDIDKAIELLLDVKKKKGRLFLLGVGGGAGNCSHAVNDFRKIARIEAYTPVDNVSELTARTNDDGWDSIFIEWLKGSNLNKNDAVMVFSVGGGNKEKNVSPNIVSALDYAKKVEAKILGIVSRDGGHTKKVADVCILVPVVSDKMITPYAEGFQAVIWHAIVNYPGFREDK